MQLGQAIAQIRKERGLTQEAFAKMYNVTRQTVSIGRMKRAIQIYLH